MSRLDQLRELPIAERIQLVEDLWDTIADKPSELRLSPAQIEELDRRLDRIRESPEEGTEWSELRSRILSSL